MSRRDERRIGRRGGSRSARWQGWHQNVTVVGRRAVNSGAGVSGRHAVQKTELFKIAGQMVEPPPVAVQLVRHLEVVVAQHYEIVWLFA